MNYILFDHRRLQFLPFTHTRAVADIRCGIFTMRERWEYCLQQTTDTLTENYLQPLYERAPTHENIYINGSVFGNLALTEALQKLNNNEKLVKDGLVLAAKTDFIPVIGEMSDRFSGMERVEYLGDVFSLTHIWEIFSHNDRAIKGDFALLTSGRTSAPLPDNINVSGTENIFLEPGARINAGCIINATTGPVYLGKDAEIMEGCIIRGALAMCDNATLKMGAKIYGPTTIGPGCKAGGEISNVVFFANSNKGHDGFLGNSVIGEWCNLGADTNSSNLKNNYDVVKIWDEQSNMLVKTDLTFCGLLMGDHSKCGINTMFNTGTVVGISCNIYGGSFPEKFIPSFSWGGSDGMVTYEFNRAMSTANRMMARRNKQLTEAEIGVNRHVFEHTATQREHFGAAGIKND